MYMSRAANHTLLLRRDRFSTHAVQGLCGPTRHCYLGPSLSLRLCRRAAWRAGSPARARRLTSELHSDGHLSDYHLPRWSWPLLYCMPSSVKDVQNCTSAAHRCRLLGGSVV